MDAFVTNSFTILWEILSFLLYSLIIAHSCQWLVVFHTTVATPIVFICNFQGYIPPDSKGEHKKSGRPVDITPYCRLSPTIPNHIHITWVPDLIQVSHDRYIFIVLKRHFHFQSHLFVNYLEICCNCSSCTESNF